MIMADLLSLSRDLAVFRGEVNVGVVFNGPSVLLIDVGQGEVLESLDQDHEVDLVAFTHHHRDQACGAWKAKRIGSRILVPEGERWLFEEVSRYWGDSRYRWHLYDLHPHHLTLTEPVKVDNSLRDWDALEWGRARIKVLSTPGHTDGSLSFLVEVDGQRTAFCGDLIYDGGRLWDIYSMQKGLHTRDYHGFMGSREELTNSLSRIAERSPDRIVPSHGDIIRNTDRAIDVLVKRVDRCYRDFAAISSLRYYFPELFADYMRGPKIMPISKGKRAPDYLLHQGTTWVLKSSEGPCLVMDCGSRDVVDWLLRLRGDGDLGEVEGLWITHYHDDHVDGIPYFRESFDCPIIADSHVSRVIESPLSWRLPCISPVEVNVDRVTGEGESWEWHEFSLSSYHLPGQTLYSGGLLVEGKDMRLLFSGDSFTPGGIDDHCCGNRNFLGYDVGYQRCIDLLEFLKPDLIFNSHVDEGFSFKAENLEFMRTNLHRRLKDFGALLPWSNPNFGMDENWVRMYPYEQVIKPGQRAVVCAVITNHTREDLAIKARIIPPRSWKDTPPGWKRATTSPGENRIPLSIKIPENMEGRTAFPVDLKMNDLDLPRIAEFILDTR